MAKTLMVVEETPVHEWEKTHRRPVEVSLFSISFHLHAHGTIFRCDGFTILLGSTALTQKSPRFNVHARVTCEIIRSNDAQCNSKE